MTKDKAFEILLNVPYTEIETSDFISVYSCGGEQKEGVIRFNAIGSDEFIEVKEENFISHYCSGENKFFVYKDDDGNKIEIAPLIRSF